MNTIKNVCFISVFTILISINIVFENESLRPTLFTICFKLHFYADDIRGESRTNRFKVADKRGNRTEKI